MSTTAEKSETFFCRHCVLRIKARYVEWGSLPTHPPCPVCGNPLEPIILAKGEHPDRVFGLLRNRKDMKSKPKLGLKHVGHSFELVFGDPGHDKTMSASEFNRIGEILRKQEGQLELKNITKQEAYEKIAIIERQIVK